jgi:dynactin complex subunit
MKSAYELAMERLNKTSPAVKPTAQMKAQLAELDSKYAAKIAEREIAANSEIEKSAATGEFEKMDLARQQLARDRNALKAELEEKKERLRQGK